MYLRIYIYMHLHSHVPIGLAESRGLAFNLDQLWLVLGLKTTSTSTPQLPFKRPHTPTKRDHKALNRGTLGGLGILVWGPQALMIRYLDPLGV